MKRRASQRTIGPAIMLGLLAFVTTVEWRAHQSASESVAERRAQLARVVAARQQTTARLEDRLAELRRDADALAARAGGKQIEEIRALADMLRAVSGSELVTGPGVVVVLSDSADASRDAADTDFRIQDADVQAVVNALWVAGAEAMAVNGERLVATTAIRNAGAAVLVNYRILSPPYTIAAIGDPLAVRASFAASVVARRFRTWASTYGLGFTVEPSEHVTLPAFGGGVRFRFAHPVEQEQRPG